MKLRIELSGGLELLFDKIKMHDIELKEDQVNISQLLVWMKNNLLKERPELFLTDESVRPGILVLINETDWDILERDQTVLHPGDVVSFISTLHGG
eukprot:TRINITY_DN4125_c0_g1_i1.p1 TRINITY_DN4125_c0_g1~~TRINITY_DN4125_c0_g1_i1.p1  ORF type:complete len:112 (-),score=18.61 TRINITY_DN4125_c0_g1_i1:103-390(-)